MYDRINYRYNEVVSDYLERTERRYYKRKNDWRYQWQERGIRWRRWSAGLHFHRIPETRWTMPISLCLAPQVGMGVSTASGIAGVRWVRTLSISKGFNGILPIRRWEGRGFFWHSHDTTEVW